MKWKDAQSKIAEAIDDVFTDYFNLPLNGLTMSESERFAERIINDIADSYGFDFDTYDENAVPVKK